MEATVCYRTLPIDDLLASLTGHMNKHEITALRSLYKEKKGRDIEIPEILQGKTKSTLTDEERESAEELLDELNDFKDELEENSIKELNEHLYNPVAIALQMKEVYSPRQRIDRINLVANLFSEVVDDIYNLEKSRGNNLTRGQIIAGFDTISEGRLYGPQFIMSEIYRKLSDYQAKCEANSNSEEFGGVKQEDWIYRAKEADTAKRYLGSLLLSANKAIREREKINIAQGLQFAFPSDLTSGSSSDLSFRYDAEESTKERWMEEIDTQDPFAHSPAEVRKFLASIEEFDTNNPRYYDDLGLPRRQRPSVLHAEIMTLFRGVQTEAGMLKRLENCNTNAYPYAKYMIQELQNNPLLRVQFFNDFSKVAQKYGMISSNASGEYPIVLNQQSRKNSANRYIANIKTHRLSTTGANAAIFDYNKDGKAVVNKQNARNLSSYIQIVAGPVYYDANGKEVATKEEYDDLVNAHNKALEKATTQEQKYELSMHAPHTSNALNKELGRINSMNARERDYSSLTDIYDTVFRALGIEVSPQVLNRIASDRTLARNLNNTIANSVNAINKLNDGEDFVNSIQNIKDSNDNAIVQQMVGEINAAVENIVAPALSKTARYNGNTYSTDVQSSHLGRFRDKIKNIIEEPGVSDNEKQANLKKFLMDEFGHSPFFYDKDKHRFRVRWLQDLYDSRISDARSFANNFDYQRLLGNSTQEFEDFGSRAQSFANIAYYLSEGADYGQFPTFILGDSGVQKFIKSPIYNEETIISDFIEAAHQDITMYKQLVAQRDALVSSFEAYFPSMEMPQEVLDKVNAAETDKEKAIIRERWKQQEKASYLGDLASIVTEEDAEEIERLREEGVYSKEEADDLLSYKDQMFALLPFLNKYAESISPDSANDDFREAIEEHLKEEFDEYKQNLIADGVLVLDNDGQVQFTKHSEEITKNGRKKVKKNSKGYRSIYPAQNHTDEMLWNYFLNHKMAMMNQIQVMTGSPAIYEGGLKGESTALQKRYKEIHATGNRLDLDAINPLTGEKYGDGNQRVVYFVDPRTDTKYTDSDFQKALEEYDEFNGFVGTENALSNKYSRDKSTDGQSIRTLDSYMAIMGMSQGMNEDLLDTWREIKRIREEIKSNRTEFTAEEKQEYEELQNKYLHEDLDEEELERLEQLKEIENGITREQIDDLEMLSTSLQPIKSILYTTEWVPDINGDMMQISVQIKHSECVVIPELLPKNSKLRHMVEWAEESNVDMLSSDSCVKVGRFGAASIHGSSTRESLVNAMNAAKVHTLHGEGYVIQQNVPEHIRQSRQIGTQSRKIALSNLKPGNYGELLETGVEEVTLGNRKVKRENITDKEIIKLYVGATIANILEDWDNFSAKLSDPEKVRRILISAAQNNDRTSTETLIGLSSAEAIEGVAARKFLIPLFEGGVEYDNAAMLFSMFRNQVVKQKMLGGSAVQASAYGLSDMREDSNLRFVKDPTCKGNILYAECEIPFDLSYTPAGSNKPVQLEWNDWVETDGRPKLSNEIVPKDDPRYKQYLSFKDKQGNVRVPLLEQRFPGILDLIASRIPTEAKYSMMPLKIVKFSLKSGSGGTIRLPLQGVTVAGFDYDIDKLYLQRREFREKHSERYEDLKTEYYWSRFYDENSLEYARLKLAQEDALSKGKPAKNRLYEYDGQGGARSKQLMAYWLDSRRESSSWQAFDNDDFIRWCKENNKDATDYEVQRESYDYSKSPWDKKQSRIGRNNLIFQLTYNNLMHPNNMRERFTPGGFDHISQAAKQLREYRGISEGQYDYADPYTVVRYNQQNQVADKLIGVFANQNANDAIASLMKTFELTVPVAFGRHSTSGLSNLIVPNNLSKELLAAAVDAVKDPCLEALNINTITANSVALLVRLGYSFTDIGLLLNQPAIRELTKKCLDYNRSDIATEIANKIESLNQDGLVDVTSETATAGLDVDTLKGAIEGTTKAGKDYAESTKDREIQIRALLLFQQIRNRANELNKFVTATKFSAAKSVQATFGDMYALMINTQNYIDELNDPNVKSTIRIELNDSQQSAPLLMGMDINDRASYCDSVSDNPFGYEQALYDTFRGMLQVMSNYFPYEQMGTLRLKLSESIIGRLDGDTINAFHRSVISYLISKEGSIFNPDGPSPHELGENAEDYYRRIVPFRIASTIKSRPEILENPLIKNLNINYSEKSHEVYISLKPGVNEDESYKETLTAGWEELASGEFRDLAIDLYMHNFYNSGTGFGAIGFNHLAPVEVKLALGENTNMPYIEELQEILGRNESTLLSQINYRDMMVQFIKANRSNYHLVYNIAADSEAFKTLSDSSLVDNPFTKTGRVPQSIVVHNSKETNFLKLRTTEGGIEWKPAFKVKLGNKEYVYIARPTNSDSITSNGGFGPMEYTLIPARSNSSTEQLTIEQMEQGEYQGLSAPYGYVAVSEDAETEGEALAEAARENAKEKRVQELADMGIEYGTNAIINSNTKDIAINSYDIGLGEVTGMSSQAFQWHARTAVTHLSLAFKDKSSKEYQEELVKRLGLKPEDFNFATSLNELKQFIKEKCEQHGYTGALNGEKLC